MSDTQVKAMAEDMEAPVFEQVAFTQPPELSEATVAIVSTASLHHEGQEDFAPADVGYRVLDNRKRDYQTGHWSPNFDAIGFAVDFNTMIPLDRLDELEAVGKIGKVSDIHLSYAGNQFDLSAIRMDSGPAGAKFLKESGVDVVIFTPV
jgi:D-proline reductase (dithiol) PrdB|tara:strand:- start:76 stop:522 length:447 start_codon:yes stop_codon:yes gene_type:complete